MKKCIKCQWWSPVLSRRNGIQGGLCTAVASKSGFFSRDINEVCVFPRDFTGEEILEDEIGEDEEKFKEIADDSEEMLERKLLI
jgi:hypothetical protein